MSNGPENPAVPGSPSEGPTPSQGGAPKGGNPSGGAGSSDDHAGDGSAADAMSGGRWTALFSVGAAIILAFVIFIIYMLVVAPKHASTETIWDRYVYVFGAAEAIAFTAVGWLFGREVNRQAASSAEKNAANATDQAKQAQKESQKNAAEAASANTAAATANAKAESLAHAVVASASHTGRPPADLQGVVGAALGASNSQLDSLRDLAVKLFPVAGD